MSVDGLKTDIFAVNFKRSGRRGTFHMEHSPLEGENSGFSVTTASATDTTIFVTASQKVFHIKTLIVNNGNANAAALSLFASDGGGKQKLTITLPAIDTVYIGAGTPGMDLNGLFFGFSYSTGGLYARVTSASTGISIFAGGQVRDQDTT